ncbi:DUF3097 family protein [Saxibacter everestensis]|uniref:DUF3097 family protein n=1 Tax=Saxibacter everestensis TaxID=2909229 RepID=A0ABY8QY19_9MICO|nr:DUF3097 family protein [Brevibacteriaceae bacterium ZFBP1038]
MSFDRYGPDILASSSPSSHRRRQSEKVEAAPGLVVEDFETGWVGAITRVEKSGGEHIVELEDRRGKLRSFVLGPGFLIDGKPVELVQHRPAAAKTTAVTASGSRAVSGARARVARGSRIWVEGKHDAELVEKIWGEDLRIEGVVVEPLGGLDLLPEWLAEFEPGRGRKVGVLADHLIEGTKETRLVSDVLATSSFREHVMVLGHPYVDIWQAVRPERLGIDAWPTIPKGTDWKTGILAHLGWPHGGPADVRMGWQRILRQVGSYADVEATLSGRVEELIDFVTASD